MATRKSPRGRVAAARAADAPQILSESQGGIDEVDANQAGALVNSDGPLEARELSSAEVCLAAANPMVVVKAPYGTGTWGGHPNYTCNRCPYATTDLEAMLAHIVGKHGAEVREGEDEGDTHS